MEERLNKHYSSVAEPGTSMQRESALDKLLDTVVHVLPLSLLSFPLSFLLFFLFLLFSSPIPPLSPPHLLNLSKPVATSVSVNHLYGYCWEEDDGEADLQWCRALVVAVRKNEVHVCQCSALTAAAPLHGMMAIRKGYLCVHTHVCTFRLMSCFLTMATVRQ